MRKKPLVIIGIIAAAVLVLGAVGVLIGVNVYRSSAADAESPAPTVAAATATDASDVDLAGEWTVASGSYAGYRVDEVLNGGDVTVTGRTEDVTGTVSSDGTTITAATIVVDLTTVATDNGNRDEYFRETALQTDTYPEATFTLTEPITGIESLADGGTVTATVTGELTLHGQTVPVTAEVEAALNGEQVQIAGSVPITFADYGVEAPNLGFVQVEPTGSIEFLVALDRAA